MTIYFVQAQVDDGPIKIGYTGGDPLRRLSQLRTGSPVALELISTIPGSREDEQQLHVLHRHDRIGGEWFHPSCGVLRSALGHIPQVAAQFDEIDDAIAAEREHAP